GAGHGDTAAHGSGADDGDLANVVDRVVFRNVGNLGYGTFGEKGVDQGARLVRCDALFEDLALALAALVKGQVDGGFDGVHNFERGEHVAACGARLVAAGGKNGGVDEFGAQFVGKLAGFAQLCALIGNFARERNGAREQIAVAPRFNNAIDQAELERLGRADGFAGNTEVERGLDAD